LCRGITDCEAFGVAKASNSTGSTKLAGAISAHGKCEGDDFSDAEGGGTKEAFKSSSENRYTNMDVSENRGYPKMDGL